LHLERKYFVFVAKSVLAGLLAVLLLLSSALAVSPAHRQSHQSDRSKETDECVFCLFAHSHVIAAESQPLLSLYATFFVACPSPEEQGAFPASDRRLSPSRAPPVGFSLVVVG